MGWLFPLIGLSIGLLLLAGFIEFGRRWRCRRQRILWEDALKQICSAKHEGRTVTCLELSGRLGLSPASTLRLTQDLEFARYVRSHAGVLELTETGEHLGLHVLRGHRLWERYLSDDSQLPLDRLHDAAERAEHHLVADELNALADHLGHANKASELSGSGRGRLGAPPSLSHLERDFLLGSCERLRWSGMGQCIAT